MNDDVHFFLGGRDLEMVTIAELLLAVAPARVHDRALPWGAKASAYRDEIAQSLTRGDRVALVELQDDLGLPMDRVIVIDHHGDRSGHLRPTSLHQVFHLLGLPAERWSRWFELVAANDRGHVAAMQAAGATPEEVRQVRAADRAAQGISPQEEEAAAHAVNCRRSFAGGRLMVVDLPHGRTATVSDRLHGALGGPGYENLLILSPEETNFYGEGGLVRLLDREVPGGWTGGDLPQRGFWGHPGPLPSVISLLHGALSQQSASRSQIFSLAESLG